MGRSGIKIVNKYYHNLLKPIQICWNRRVSGWLMWNPSLLVPRPPRTSREYAINMGINLSWSKIKETNIWILKAATLELNIGSYIECLNKISNFDIINILAINVNIGSIIIDRINKDKYKSILNKTDIKWSAHLFIMLILGATIFSPTFGPTPKFCLVLFPSTLLVLFWLFW